MNRYSFILFFMILILSMNGQIQLTGNVKNSNNKEPLPGTVIYIPDLKKGSVSDATGNFTITNLPPIRTLVQVKLLGYKTKVVDADLSSSLNMEIELEESIIEEEEVVITGSSRATEIKKNPAPMISINQELLQENTYNNIVEALAKTPGISAISSGPNISKPVIRGLGFNRILTMFDGVRQDGQQWGDEHGIEIDQFLVNRVEIIKGPASLIYGSDALAGVINFLPANPLPEGKIKASIESDLQSNNKQAGSSVKIDGTNKGIHWGMVSSGKIASNYRNKSDGAVYGTKYDEQDLNLHLGVQKKWGYANINYSYYDNRQEVPDGSRDSSTRKFVKTSHDDPSISEIVSNKELNSHTIGDVYQRVIHQRLYSGASLFFGRHRIDLNAGIQQSNRREFEDTEHPESPSLSLLLNTLTYDVKYHLPEFKKWSVVAGMNGMAQQNKNNDAHEFLIPDYSSTDAGLFFLIKKNFKKLDLAFGARYDIRQYNGYALYTTTDPHTGHSVKTGYNASDTNLVKQFDAFSELFQGFSGSIGATYEFKEGAGLKLNLARGYRAPNVSELSAKGIHPGTGYLQIGDGSFSPEFNTQGDVGIYFENEHISAQMDGFYNLINNYIYNEKLVSKIGGDSLFSDGGEQFPVFKFRQTQAALYGGELSFDIHPHPLDWLHFENSIALLYADNLGGNGATISDSTKYLPFIPPIHTNTELRAEFKKRKGCFANTFVKIGMQYFASQKRVFSAYGTETETPEYLLFDAGIGTSIVNKKGQTILTMQLSGTNLSDVAYQNHLSRLKYMDNYPVNASGRSGIYSMGRNFCFKLIIPINIK